MRWGTVIDAVTAHTNERDVDPQELQLAQLVTVRLVLLQANGNKLDEDDWQNLFRWLNLGLPEESSPRFDDYRGALKGWLSRAVKQVAPDQPVECLLTHLVEHVAELLQLDEIEQHLLMLASPSPRGDEPDHAEHRIDSRHSHAVTVAWALQRCHPQPTARRRPPEDAGAGRRQASQLHGPGRRHAVGLAAGYSGASRLPGSRAR